MTRPSWLDAQGAWLQRCCGPTAFLIFLLAGCAASAPPLSPADYPFHSVALPTAKYPSTYPVPSEAPQIELHWRLTVDSNRVQADGLIERQQESQIQETWLQLVGIDAGRVRFVYPCSTAAKGTGSRDGSYQTPLGWHVVRERIGEGLPPGAVLVDRKFNGKVWSPENPTGAFAMFASVRTSNPAAATSTSESASSATTSTRRMRSPPLAPPRAAAGRNS